MLGQDTTRPPDDRESKDRGQLKRDASLKTKQVVRWRQTNANDVFVPYCAESVGGADRRFGDKQVASSLHATVDPLDVSHHKHSDIDVYS